MKPDIINNDCIIFNADSYKLLEKFKNDKDNHIISKEDNYIDLVLIDPPYDIPTMHKNNKATNKLSIRKNKIFEQIEDFASGFDFKIFDLLKTLQQKTNIFIFCNKTLLIDLIKYFDKDKYLFEILIWHKTNAIPLINNVFIPEIEYILYIRDRGIKLQGDYSLRKKVYSSGTNQSDKKKYNHPTVKPVQILNNLISVATEEDAVVLDCFMGTGSTGVACRRTNRKFIGIEINKKFYETAKKRLIDEHNAINIFDYE